MSREGIDLYGYLNQVQSSRRLERECGRSLELIWLTGRLKPDFKTIADFRKDNSPTIRKVCQQFVALCRNMDLLDCDVVAIDGSRFKAVNSKAKNYTRGKLRQKLGEIDKAIERYLTASDGQFVRHHHKSNKEHIDKERPNLKKKRPLPITKPLSQFQNCYPHAQRQHSFP